MRVYLSTDCAQPAGDRVGLRPRFCETKLRVDHQRAVRTHDDRVQVQLHDLWVIFGQQRTSTGSCAGTTSGVGVIAST